MNDAERAARKLSSAICDAVCTKSVSAKEWLHLNKAPTIDEIKTPDPASFIAVCVKLDIDWQQLNKSLIDAANIPEEEPSNCTLVQVTELSYSVCNETDFDGERARKNP